MSSSENQDVESHDYPSLRDLLAVSFELSGAARGCDPGEIASEVYLHSLVASRSSFSRSSKRGPAVGQIIMESQMWRAMALGGRLPESAFVGTKNLL